MKKVYGQTSAEMADLLENQNKLKKQAESIKENYRQESILADLSIMISEHQIILADMANEIKSLREENQALKAKEKKLCDF